MRRRKLSSKQAMNGTMVSQLRNERLPEQMRMNWKLISSTPAMCRASRGQKENQGTTSSMKKFQRTPNFWNQCGAKCR